VFVAETKKWITTIIDRKQLVSSVQVVVPHHKGAAVTAAGGSIDSTVCTSL
jgi:hypothetical protein